MVVTKLIRDLPSSDIKKKKYSVSFFDGANLLYSYETMSYDYGGGAFSPSYADIVQEANDVIQTTDFVCDSVDVSRFSNVSLGSFRVSNIESIFPSNGDVLGSYLNSESSYQSNILWVFFTNIKHNFEYGYVIETFNIFNSIYYLYKGKISNGPPPKGSEILSTKDCHSLFLSYVITSLPDTRIETTCCILACCEPDKYKLI